VPPTTCQRMFALAILAFAAVACGRQAEPQREGAATPLVEALPARFGSLPIEETVSGVVRARNQVAIRAEIEARVMEVAVRSGEAVERGQLLVRLDPTEPRERLRQAEADVRLVEASAVAARARKVELETRVARMRSLAEEALVSAQELETLEAQLDAVAAAADEAQARVDQARAVVEERRSALAKSEVRAPVTGHLGERRVEVGMLVDPATVLFVIGDLGELIVEVTLTEAMLDTVRQGQSVVIEPRGAGEPVEAAISRISPFLAAQSFTTIGEIDVDNGEGRLRPGMFVNVRILVGESRSGVLVPVAALWEDPTSGERGVFSVEETEGLAEPSGATGERTEGARRVAFRPVRVLAEGGGVAGIEGVEEGSWVVTVGQHLIATQAESPQAGPEAGSASTAVAVRVRPVSWQRVRDLQNLQDEDLLEGFLDRQRKVAAALGAEIPESEDAVNRVLEEAAAAERERTPGGRAGS